MKREGSSPNFNEKMPQGAIIINPRQRPSGTSMADTILSAVIALTTASFLLLSMSPAAVHGQSDAGGGSCHLRELDLCAASMLVFTQAPNGLATSDPDINKQCVHLNEASGCLKNYTRRCMTPMQRELINFAANASFQLLDEYCTKGSKLRQSYLKHAQCLNQIHKRQEHKSCLRDLQAALELLTSSQPNAANAKQDLQKPTIASAGGQGDTNGKRLQLACCTLRRLESCMGSQTEKRCGKETIQFIQSTMQRATSRLPETVCRNFKPDGPECRALLPKSGAAPRGSKSNSIISRLLSTYTGL